jgi:cytochrome bd-type quinol oxidase subunit 2
MTKTQIAPESDRLIALRENGQTVPAPRSLRWLSPFWRHFAQMFAAMVVGMIATGAIFLSVVGAKTWDEVTTEYPNQALLAMAAGMSIPMAAWMVYRDMGRRHSLEMAAAMVLPVVPFLCLVWFNVTASAQCGPYCIATIATMLGVMFYRRDRYSSADRSPAGKAGR